MHVNCTIVVIIFSAKQRQVGFDRQGRPVIFLSFIQSSALSCSVEESVHHITHLMENAGRSARQGAHDFVWVVDFNGEFSHRCPTACGWDRK